MKRVILSIVLMVLISSCEEDILDDSIVDTTEQQADEEETADETDDQQDDGETNGDNEDTGDEGENSDDDGDTNQDEGTSDDENDSDDGDNQNDDEGDDEDDGKEEVEDGVGMVTAYLLVGNWEVTQYIQKTGIGAENFTDSTQEFSGFVFDFMDTGMVKVSQSGNMIFETVWSVEQADEEGAGIFVVLDFSNATGTLALLDNRWDVTSARETRIGSIIGTLDTTNGIDDRTFFSLERI